MKSARRSRKESVSHNGVKVDFISTQLPFCDGTDLLADILGVIAPHGGSYFGGYATGAEALGQAAKEFVGGKLTGLLSRLLAGTTMNVAGDGKVDLIDSREKLDLAFTGREVFLPSAVKLALEVNFKGFLDGLGLIGLKMPTPSSSRDSSQSTTATGESTG